MSKRQLSEAAQAASIIRKELKKNGIPAKVRSRIYSMGSSVDVDLIDALPAVYEKVRAFCSSFQYGSFDAMQDLYEYTNNRDDIPQVRHVLINSQYSDEVQQSCWEFLRERLSGMEDAPASYEDAYTFRHYSGEWGCSLLSRELRPYYRGQGIGFWATQKPRVSA